MGIFRPETAQYGGMTIPAKHLRFGGRNFTEDADFVQSGRTEAQRLQKECGLNAHSSVLEIGCGPGRLPIGILGQVGTIKSYLGLDVSKTPILWCSRHISRTHPAFRFRHIDVYNPRYNKTGTMLQKDLHLPADDLSVDIIYLYSVFSHLDETDIRSYVREFSRVLRPDGTVFLTAFVEDGVPTMSENPQDYGPGQWRGALHCVRYDATFFRSLLAEYGFTVSKMDHGTETDGQSAFYLKKQA